MTPTDIEERKIFWEGFGLGALCGAIAILAALLGYMHFYG